MSKLHRNTAVVVIHETGWWFYLVFGLDFFLAGSKVLAKETKNCKLFPIALTSAFSHVTRLLQNATLATTSLRPRTRVGICERIVTKFLATAIDMTVHYELR